MSGGTVLKIKFIEDETLQDDTLVIKAKSLTPEVQAILNELQNTSIQAIYRGSDIVLDPKDILFFETEQNTVYAHALTESFETRYKLYELEDLLSNRFIRISKSTIANIQEISSIERNITSSRKISFFNSVKVVYVSRMYYPLLKEKLNERSL